MFKIKKNIVLLIRVTIENEQKVPFPSLPPTNPL